jgi:Ca2+/H+ antiporter, TMEM165/GDT1 family
MNFEKVAFGFFVLLALTLNFGFVMGDIDNPDHHHVWELYAALIVSLISTILKFGDRTHIGAVLLATSLVADLQLVAAVLVWGLALYVFEIGNTPGVVASVVSLAGGALLANFASVTLLIIETVSLRR